MPIVVPKIFNLKPTKMLYIEHTHVNITYINRCVQESSSRLKTISYHKYFSGLRS
uniref:Uncharacterized protein n=1 Tax=uncultured gamma proteobacterium HF0070_08D07 TaxID=710983 RepID=E0XRV3_9GAMM|nr:hypothetical protein [uncultured gamma proteobacterium HF0070_08D07]